MSLLEFVFIKCNFSGSAFISSVETGGFFGGILAGYVTDWLMRRVCLFFVLSAFFKIVYHVTIKCFHQISLVEQEEVILECTPVYGSCLELPFIYFC